MIIIDTESQEVIANYTPHSMAIRSLAWSPDSQWLFTGSDDARIVLHDIRAGSKDGSAGKGEGAVAVLQGHQGWVLDLGVGPDAKLLGSRWVLECLSVYLPVEWEHGGGVGSSDERRKRGLG